MPSQPFTAPLVIGNPRFSASLLAMYLTRCSFILAQINLELFANTLWQVANCFKPDSQEIILLFAEAVPDNQWLEIIELCRAKHWTFRVVLDHGKSLRVWRERSAQASDLFERCQFLTVDDNLLSVLPSKHANLARLWKDVWELVHGRPKSTKAKEAFRLAALDMSVDSATERLRFLSTDLPSQKGYFGIGTLGRREIRRNEPGERP